MRHPATLITFDKLDFAPAWEFQRHIVRERAANRCGDALILLEHNPVFTIGRSGQALHCGGSEESLRRHGLPVFHVERGGSVTYHGPGQIVGYPILRLRPLCSGPKTYMRLLEEVVIRVLAEWGIYGRRLDKRTGVWVGEHNPHKIAAMGVRIADGVTMHGFALNVMLDLEPFRHIQPCGIPNCRVTSMAELLGQPVDLAKVRLRIADIFAEVFGLTWAQDQNVHDFAFLAKDTPSPRTGLSRLMRPGPSAREAPVCENHSPCIHAQGGSL